MTLFHLARDPKEILNESTVAITAPRDLLELHTAVRTRSIQQLVLKFIAQLQTGCGDEQCTALTCHTYRKRVADKPLRKLNGMSLRAIAFHLASCQEAQMLLCKTLVPAAYASVKLPKSASLKDPLKDPKSFAQHLLDTSTIRELLLKPEADILDPTNMIPIEGSFQSLSYISAENTSALASLFESCTSATYVKTALLKFAEQSCFYVLRDASKVLKSFRDCSTAAMRCDTMHWWSSLVGPLSTNSLVVAIDSILEAECSDAETAHVIEICIALWQSQASEQLCDSTAPMMRLVAQVARLVCRSGAVLDCVDEALHHDLIFWMEHLTLVCWDGGSTVNFNSVLHDALQCLRLLYHHNSQTGGPQVHTHKRFQVEISSSLSQHFSELSDPIKVATAIVDGVSANHVPLLTFPFLFFCHTQVAHFRAICYLRMARSVDEAVLVSKQISMTLHLATAQNKWDRVATSLMEKLRNACSTHLALAVRRDFLLEDVIHMLWGRGYRELTRPLRIRIDNLGEVGVDQGGVSQEFFQLAIREAFREEYKPLYKFEILGVIVALAVHNGYTLPLTFPLVVYRKLIGLMSQTVHDIADGWPSHSKGLDELLKYEGDDVHNHFGLSYAFTFHAFGRAVDVDMRNDRNRDTKWSPLAAMVAISPDAPPVDNSNRNDYVKDFIYWLTHKSVEAQFNAFAKGFFTCIPQKFVQTLHPITLRDLVEGYSHISIDVLKHAARYEGFSANDRVIQDFWDVVSLYDPQRMRQLLEFVTASVRLPVAGLWTFHFTIARNGGSDDDRLPTSATCTRTLLLPPYEDRQKLEDKLGKALDNAQGFGLR